LRRISKLGLKVNHPDEIAGFRRDHFELKGIFDPMKAFFSGGVPRMKSCSQDIPASDPNLRPGDG
jgi:hypothetical protein